ncbi:hypothetical protein PAMC26577_36560 [Caballeronia sordidicola]|uniref:Uncharacterized protein n=1 Tax=Caballeronia sordidicola TaxID=196367 RepID=A0A242M8M8_CABSO|nr:hypothetical protein PAMC26577_36560 [Caballeronia sordidicola]
MYIGRNGKKLSGRAAFLGVSVNSRHCRVPTAPCPDYSPEELEAIREAAGQSGPNSSNEPGRNAHVTGTNGRNGVTWPEHPARR